MFKRIRESHDADVFTDAASVERYAREARKSTLKFQAFLETCQALELGTRALDVGAGPGVLAVLLAERHPDLHITALDSSPLMIEAGQQYVSEKGLEDRITYVQGDAADADFVASLGQFDFIYATFTLHHWDPPQPVIRNLCAARAEGAIIFLYDLRRAWWLYWVPSRRGFFRSVRSAYQRPEVEAMLHEMGITTATVTNTIPFLLSVLIR